MLGLYIEGSEVSVSVAVSRGGAVGLMLMVLLVASKIAPLMVALLPSVVIPP